MEEKVMNLIQKLSAARLELSKKNLKMSGKNTFANYEYFELGDILPAIAEVENKYKMLSVINFGTEIATLTLYDAESDNKMEFVCEVKDSEIKGASPIQQYGGMQTYTRRYLYLNLYNFAEVDAGEITFNPNDKKEYKKPYSAKEEKVEEMDIQTALDMRTTKGKRYEELEEGQLDYIIENSKNPKFVQAAKLVKEFHKVELEEMAANKEDLPFMEEGCPF